MNVSTRSLARIGSHGQLQHAVAGVSVCQGGNLRSCVLTSGEGSCLLRGFDAKALVREEFGRAVEDGLSRRTKIFWKPFSKSGGEGRTTTRLFLFFLQEWRNANINWWYCQKMKGGFWGTAKPNRNALWTRGRSASSSGDGGGGCLDLFGTIWEAIIWRWIKENKWAMWTWGGKAQH